MTRDIRQAAAMANNPEYMSLWAGQGLRLAKARPAAAIIKQTMDQAILLANKRLHSKNDQSIHDSHPLDE